MQLEIVFKETASNSLLTTKNFNPYPGNNLQSWTFCVDKVKTNLISHYIPFQPSLSSMKMGFYHCTDNFPSSPSEILKYYKVLVFGIALLVCRREEGKTRNVKWSKVVLIITRVNCWDDVTSQVASATQIPSHTYSSITLTYAATGNTT